MKWMKLKVNIPSVLYLLLVRNCNIKQNDVYLLYIEYVSKNYQNYIPTWSKVGLDRIIWKMISFGSSAAGQNQRTLQRCANETQS